MEVGHASADAVVKLQRLLGSQSNLRDVKFLLDDGLEPEVVLKHLDGHELGDINQRSSGQQ